MRTEVANRIQRRFLFALLGSTALVSFGSSEVEACGGSGIPATAAAVALSVGVPQPGGLSSNVVFGVPMLGVVFGAVAGIGATAAFSTAEVTAVAVVVGAVGGLAIGLAVIGVAVILSGN